VREERGVVMRGLGEREIKENRLGKRLERECGCSSNYCKRLDKNNYFLSMHHWRL
jgi:hypothetical protein